METGAINEVDWGAAEVVVDPGVGLSKDQVLAGLKNSPEMAALVNWASEMQTYTNPQGVRKGSIIHRDQYVTPGKVFEQFMLARHAAEHDDTVSGVIESTESLAFSKVKFDHPDSDQEDVWNQLAKVWDLDSLLRKCWRDLFIYSQFIIAAQPGVRDFSVRGKSDKGNKKRKQFPRIKTPVSFRLIDPTLVIPFGNFLFGGERLAYIARTDAEATAIRAALASNGDDPVKSLLIKELKEPEFAMGKELSKYSDGRYSASGAAFEMNPANVYRHTETKPDYMRFAPVKMKSIFELLDLKTQLRANDRATLIGATNFIVLIKKGSDAQPARPQELASLKSHARSLAKMPLLIGDHRLDVEIITPKTDNTLKPERVNGLNSAITSRLYLLYSAGNYSSGTKGDNSMSLTRMAARGLESRRHMIRRVIERFIIDKIVEANDALDEAPDLRFQPASIALEFDQARSAFMLELRMANELSRETLLTEFDFDQDDEAKRLEYEKDHYDDIFQTINPNNQGQPGSGVGPANPAKPTDTKAAGRAGGGNRNGGGAAPGTGQGQPPRNPTSRSK